MPAEAGDLTEAERVRLAQAAVAALQLGCLLTAKSFLCQVEVGVVVVPQRALQEVAQRPPAFLSLLAN